MDNNFAFEAPYWVIPFLKIGQWFHVCFNPQRKSSRKTFFKEILLWIFAGAICEAFSYLLIEAIDYFNYPLVVVQVIESLFITITYLWLFALFMLSARRARDAGLSGASAFFLTIPILNIFYLLLLVILPTQKVNKKLKALLIDAKRL